MRAHSLALRRQAVERWEAGEYLRHIARDLQVDYQTLRGWIKRYRLEGPEALATRYAACGRRGRTQASIKEEALRYKRQHLDWGGGYIRLQLQKAYVNTFIPGARQLQRWFDEANVRPPRTQLPKYPLDWAKRPLQRVQVDAKERLQTADGKPCCYLTYTDEYSGSALDAFVFPLRTYQTSTGTSGVGYGSLRAVALGLHRRFSSR